MKTKSILTILSLAAVFLFISGIEVKAQEIAKLGASEIIIPESAPQESFVREPFVQEPWDIIGRNTGRSNERNSRLMLSKRYDGETVSTKGIFNIESSTTRLRLSIDGSVKSGTITVTVLLPDNKTFKTITINDAADIQWSESINIKEGETTYHGNWKYEIATKAAQGSYRLSINSF